MIRSYSFPWALFLAVVMVGCSDYPHLNRDLEDYRPPVYTLLSPSEKPENTEDSRKTDFDREKEQINREKALGRRRSNPLERRLLFSRRHPGF